ncbi:hypothetical protein HDU99_000825, partial [Rhizoclosmatium hyalinum]
GKKTKADELVSQGNSGKKAKHNESATKQLERIKDSEPEELTVKQTPKPAKNKKEAASRAGGGSGGMSESIWLLDAANATGAASLAIQKKSQTTTMQ